MAETDSPHATPAPRVRDRSVMRQEWRNLLFLHWKVEPRLVEAALPPGLRPDLFRGEAWVGIVPFEMRGVRPRGLPAVPKLSFFLELNVRTYVVDRAGRSGVWFLSLDCDQPLACALARRFFHLNYRDAAMALRPSADGWFHYASRLHGAPLEAVTRFRYRPASEQAPAPALAGTLEHFLVERYRLFSWDGGRGRLFTGLVEHAPYVVTPAEVPECETEPLWRSHGLEVPEEMPASALFSAGVRVKVHAIERVD